MGIWDAVPGGIEGREGVSCAFCLCAKGEDCFSPLGLPPTSGRKIFLSWEVL